MNMIQLFHQLVYMEQIDREKKKKEKMKDYEKTY